ncbi:hypothetical protein F5887DRAFT_963037 [Amanita rubescens]|nr:hypothetical protein F5887DRAFT_963037 [Amanita rubescens]
MKIRWTADTWILTMAVPWLQWEPSAVRSRKRIARDNVILHESAEKKFDFIFGLAFRPYPRTRCLTNAKVKCLRRRPIVDAEKDWFQTQKKVGKSLNKRFARVSPAARPCSNYLILAAGSIESRG